MITLYDMERSGNCYKARLLFGLLGVEYKKHTVDLSKKEQMEPWFLAINPLHTVPVLDDTGTVIRDSNAVLVYLAAKYDAPRTWYPASPAGMAEVQQWLAYANNEILNALAAVRAIGLGLRPGNLAEAQEKARSVLSFLEASLTGRDWLAASHPTIADIACYPYASLVTMGGMTHDAYPRLTAWFKRIEAMKGYVPLPVRPVVKA